MEERATESGLWYLIGRLQGPEGDHLSSGAVARIHAIIDDCQPGTFPDADSQTKQARWIKDRAERDDK